MGCAAFVPWTYVASDVVHAVRLVDVAAGLADHDLIMSMRIQISNHVKTAANDQSYVRRAPLRDALRRCPGAAAPCHRSPGSYTAPFELSKLSVVWPQRSTDAPGCGLEEGDRLLGCALGAHFARMGFIVLANGHDLLATVYMKDHQHEPRLLFMHPEDEGAILTRDSAASSHSWRRNANHKMSKHGGGH